MGLFSPTFTVLRTIWPYEEGWGVTMEMFGNPMTVLLTGATEEKANQYADELRRYYKKGKL